MKQKLLTKLLILLLCTLGGASSVWADPTVLFHETFGNNTGSARAWSDDYSVKSGVLAVYSGITGYTVSNVKQGKNTTGSTASGMNQSTAGTDAYIIIGPLNVADYESLAVTYQWKAASVSKTYSTHLYYATSSSGAYTEVSGTGTGATSFVVRSYSLPAAAQVSTLYLKIVWNTSNTQAIIDEVELTGIASGGSSAVETTTTINDSGITNTNKYVNTVAGSLSATVKDDTDEEIDGATVTWSGNDNDVATINATTGEVTLVGAGTVTFTATYAGVDDEYQSSYDTYEMTVANEDPDIKTIWSEDFSTYDADDVPSGGTYSYVCANGNTNTKIYDAYLAGGTTPEILISNGGGTFSATIPLLYPTYGYDGDLTLRFKTNNTNVAVSTSTVGVTVTGSVVSGTSTLTLSGVTTATENVVITFTNSTASNVRLDDIVLKGKQAELSVVATPSISPASGAVVSGTEVTMTCATGGATIYYTMDGTTPTSSSTAYNPASKPTITSACTIKAIGIKGGLTDSGVASVGYTIAEPCATPTFSVAAGEVDKGTKVTITCATDDATIYYTTNGSTPTTSSLVYSSALTINTDQTIKAIAAKEGNANSEVASAAYTVRDYASLPFSFTSGSSAIESTTGLTQNGLGSDYASSPKLKFDGTGDYVILKVGQAPGTLYFDVKGNPGSGSWTGTFKVQTSTDGSSYSDLVVYTDNLSTSKETKTLTVPSDARYIKWILTDKKANVALGNITLTGCESITIGSAGYTTYTTTGKVTMPSGVTAYIATAINPSTVHLEEVSNVPANEPIILKADAGTYYLPVITSDADDVSANILQASNGNVTGDGSTIFALAKKNEVVGFYLVGDGVPVPAGKAYLDLDNPGVKGFTFEFEDTEDGINGLTPDPSPVGEGSIYNLAGQKLSKMQKGINIVNGKKIMK